MAPRRLRLGLLVGVIAGLAASQACGPTAVPEREPAPVEVLDLQTAWQAAAGDGGGGGPQVCRLPPTPIGGNSCIFEAAGSPPGPHPDGSVFVPNINSCQDLVGWCVGALLAGVTCNPVLGGHGIYDVGIRSSDDAGNTINYIWGCAMNADGGVTRYCAEADWCLGALSGGAACTLSVASCSPGGASCQSCSQVLANATGCSVQAANGTCQAGSNCYATAPSWCTASPQPVPDAGSGGGDAGAPGMDAGAPPGMDAGTPTPDAGMPPLLSPPMGGEDPPKLGN
ncbi:MAG TPA: hypothetical protein VIG99_08705 [Myxococcaceae bacterium]|jgi:hypothetical protein